MTARRRIAAFLVPVLCLVGVVGGVGSAGAATPGEVSTIPVGAACFGSEIAGAPKEGILLRTCEGSGGTHGVELANLLPSGQLVRLAGLGSSEGPILAGPAGEIWAAESFAEFPYRPASVTRVAADGGVATYPIPLASKDEREMTVGGLAIGAEGALWAAVGESLPIGGPPFETSYGGELARISPDGSVATFPVPDQVEPRGIALGPEGNLWFTGARGAYSGEHSYSAGVGYVGRVTPAGAFTLFRTPVRGSGPSAIAAAPNGSLWFVGGGIGRIGGAGKFGPRYQLRPPTAISGLVFGPEGDAWMSVYGGGNPGVLRLTSAGQQTLYPGGGEALTVGPEGDIWSLGEKGAERIVPGGPGIDIREVGADRATRRVSVHLACGGSGQRCQGTLELALVIPDVGAGNGKKGGRKPPLPIAQASYSLGPEKRATVTVRVPAKIFRKARRLWRPAQPVVVARATVAGGPALERRFSLSPFG
jgi:streptogramin lyase